MDLSLLYEERAQEALTYCQLLFGIFLGGGGDGFLLYPSLTTRVGGGGGGGGGDFLSVI